MNRGAASSLFVGYGKHWFFQILESWQISEIATDVYQKYYFLSLEEFILVLKKGRTGEFGKVYDRLDGPIIYNNNSIYSPCQRGLYKILQLLLIA
jgi:hypothetical protein